MHLPLRKALKLRKQLETALARVDLPLSVELSVLVLANRENPQDAVAEGVKALVARKERQVRLLGILRDLRIAIARENVEAGIDGFLARAADLDRRIAMEKAVVEAARFPGEEHLRGEVVLVHDALRAGDRHGYGEPSRTVTASVVTQELRSEAARNLVALRAEREAVEDERTAANAGRRIEIADGDVELLREAGIA